MATSKSLKAIQGETAELRTSRERSEFLLLPDGKRINLTQVESYNPYGENGVVFKLASGTSISWEAPQSIPAEKQRAQRDEVLHMLDRLYTCLYPL